MDSAKAKSESVKLIRTEPEQTIATKGRGESNTNIANQYQIKSNQYQIKLK
jgi:hypothetical protein